jgi:hypothetical protein
MKPLTTKELERYSWMQLLTLIGAIESELPSLSEGSPGRRNALINLYSIRQVLQRRQL